MSRSRAVGLSSFAGKQVSALRLVSETGTAAGAWAASFHDLALVNSDGGAVAVYSGQAANPVAFSGSNGATNQASQVNLWPGRYEPSVATTYYHEDQIGSSRLLVGGEGWPVWQGAFLPFGQELNSQATTNHYKFSGKERDAESGLDNFGARYDSSSMGRFMSPDPMFMNDHHLFDPQELNLYSYVRNNPLSLTDPTGLDLWLKGCGKDTATCHKGYVDTWDKDNKHFTGTHLSGDLTNSASLDRRGVTVKYNGGSYQGVWDTNKGENNAAQVAGAGALNGFTATINGNCSNTCVVSGFLSMNGNKAVSGQAMSALGAPGSGYQRNAGFDSFDVFHKSDGSFDINFRGYLPDDPEGLPSTHVPIPNQPGQDVGFHVDGRYPYENAVGFAEHTGSVVKTIIQTIAPPKTPQ